MDHGAGQGHPLPLTTRQLVGVAVEQLGDVQLPGHLRDPLGRARLPAYPQAEGEVVSGRQMRVQRVVLEHHRHVAAVRGEARDVAVANEHAPRGGFLQAGQDPQGGGLARPGRADQHQQLAGIDRQFQSGQRRHLAVALLHPLEANPHPPPAVNSGRVDSISCRTPASRSIRP